MLLRMITVPTESEPLEVCTYHAVTTSVVDSDPVGVASFFRIRIGIVSGPDLYSFQPNVKINCPFLLKTSKCYLTYGTENLDTMTCVADP